MLKIRRSRATIGRRGGRPVKELCLAGVARVGTCGLGGAALTSPAIREGAILPNSARVVHRSPVAPEAGRLRARPTKGAHSGFTAARIVSKPFWSRQCHKTPMREES